MKFTSEQKELLALLPTEIKKSDELTDSAKLVLANIYFLYGMDKAKENGFVICSNEKMLKDTCLGSKTTLERAIALLVNMNYITTKRGTQKRTPMCTNSGTPKCTASTYTLTDKCTKKCTIDERIKSIENELIMLKKENEELKSVLKSVLSQLNSNGTPKCTTDTESDTDKEKDIDTGMGNSISTGKVETTPQQNNNIIGIESSLSNEVLQNINNIKLDINANMDGMFKYAKTQSQFDCYYENLKTQLNKLKEVMPEEMYNNYHTNYVKRWFEKSKPYFKFNVKTQNETKSSIMEMLPYHLESFKIHHNEDAVRKDYEKLIRFIERCQEVYTEEEVKNMVLRVQEALKRYRKSNTALDTILNEYAA